MPQEKVTVKFNRLARDANYYHGKFVEYIRENHDKSDDAPDIKYLLDTYLQLADCYYQQFKESLSTRLNTLNEDSAALAKALKAISDLSDSSVKDSLKTSQKAIDEEYRQLLDKIPFLLHQTLSKLATEWGRVYEIITVSRVTPKDKKMKEFIDVLTPVVRAASHSVGIDANNLFIIPQIGGQYALQFFNYANNFMVLSMPIFALNAPWEWSIIWHEMAGYLVRQLRESEFEIVNQRLAQQIPYKQAFTRANQRLRQVAEADPQELNPVAKELAQYADVIRENMTTLAAAALGQSVLELQACTNQENSYQTADQFTDFNAQLQALRQEISQERGHDECQEFLNYGWSADWLEELFEDAFSARFFGWPFLEAFSRILSWFEDGGKGLRHPPRRVRILVAKKIIELTSSIDHTEILNTESLPKLAIEFSIEEKTTKPVVTWRVPNNTNEIWSKGYQLQFVRGTARPYRGTYSLPEVKSHTIAEIPISLKAPDEPGHYYGEWRLINDKGIPLGIVTVSFSVHAKEIPLERYIISLVARRIHHVQSLLQMNQVKLDALEEFTDLINNTIYTVQAVEFPSSNDLHVETSQEEPLLANNLDHSDESRKEQQIILRSLPSKENVKKLWQKKPSTVSPDEAEDQGVEQVQAIGRIIGEAMKSWVLVKNNDEDTAANTIEKLKKYSLEEPAAMGANFDEPGNSADESVSFIERIKTMDYTELLDLRFTDIDFGWEPPSGFIDIVGTCSNIALSIKKKWQTRVTVNYRTSTDKNHPYEIKVEYKYTNNRNNIVKYYAASKRTLINELGFDL